MRQTLGHGTVDATILRKNIKIYLSVAFQLVFWRARIANNRLQTQYSHGWCSLPGNLQ